MYSIAMKWKTDCFDKDPPFHRLTSDQPTLPAGYVSPLCRPQAYGRWAIPKLLKELHSKCPEIVSSALNTLMDLVHDPEKTFEAINLRIVNRMSDLMLNEDPGIRERVLIILETIAGQDAGRKAICNNELTLMSLLKLYIDKIVKLRNRATKLTLTISDSWLGCDTLIRYDFIETINSLLLKEEADHVVVNMLIIFLHLIRGEGKNIAYGIGAYDTLITLISRATAVVVEAALNCLAVVLTLKVAKKKASKEKLIDEVLFDLLNHYRGEVYAAAANCIMFATHRTTVKQQCYRIEGLLNRLILLSYDRSNPRLQIFCLKALTNLAEYPPNRKNLFQYHYERIEKIPIDNSRHLPFKTVQNCRAKLLEIINWKPGCQIETKNTSPCFNLQ